MELLSVPLNQQPPMKSPSSSSWLTLFLPSAIEAPVSMLLVLVTVFLRFVFLLSYAILNSLAERYIFFRILRYFVFLYFRICLKFLPPFVCALIPNKSKLSIDFDKKLLTYQYDDDDDDGDIVFPSRDSGVGRGLWQVLCLVNETPMNSRKYDSVRMLAEKLIRENLEQGTEDLIEINRTALSLGFRKTLNQLESTITPEEIHGYFGLKFLCAYILNITLNFHIPIVNTFLNTFIRCVRFVISLWESKEDPTKSLRSAEKFASELLWLAEEMAHCRCGDAAVQTWASASNLANLSLKTEPQVQGYIVRISAFLFKKARELEREMEKEMQWESRFNMEEMKVKMLTSWIPLLCQASVGTDSALQSISERKEMEKVLSDLISSVKNKKEKENVLSLWLQNYTSSPHSDWPNLHDSYTSWYSDTRQKMVMKAITY